MNFSILRQTKSSSEAETNRKKWLILYRKFNHNKRIVNDHNHSNRTTIQQPFLISVAAEDSVELFETGYGI